MRVSYYYDDKDQMVEKPGECCDYCGKLALIKPAGTLVPMPHTAIDDEYGHEKGDIHMHPKCALRWYKRHKKELAQAEKALRKRGLI